MGRKQICLVGCGTIGQMHAKHLSDHADLYFYSRSRASAEAFLSTFGGKGVFADYQSVLSDAAIDAVVITSPPEVHEAQVVQALQVGKSVLVEKPMCVSPGEVEAIGEAEAASNAFLMVAENYYYKPSLEKMKSLITEGAIGTVQSVRVQKVFTQAADGWKAGYGALLEGGIHFVALISDLFDAAPEQVEGIFPDGKVARKRHSVTRMRYAGGEQAELHYAWNVKSLTKGVFQHSQIVGDEGKIVFESNGIYFYVLGKHRSGVFFPGFKDLMGTRRMISDFLSCLEEAARRPYSGFEKAKRDLGVVFQAYGMA